MRQNVHQNCGGVGEQSLGLLVDFKDGPHFPIIASSRATSCIPPDIEADVLSHARRNDFPTFLPGEPTQNNTCDHVYVNAISAVASSF
jgi:hypothetical protein